MTLAKTWTALIAASALSFPMTASAGAVDRRSAFYPAPPRAETFVVAQVPEGAAPLRTPSLAEGRGSRKDWIMGGLVAVVLVGVILLIANGSNGDGGGSGGGGY